MVRQLLRPTWIKLIFLAEWLIFILITWFQGGLVDERQVLIAAYPLVFFYLIGGSLEIASGKTQRIVRGWRLLLTAVGLVLIDQAVKLWVATFIPYRTARPLIPGWLHLAHSCNFQGSWIFAQFDVPAVNLIPLGVAAFFMLCCSWFGHRYYIAHQRTSLWADVAFLGVFAGLASWLAEMSLRGHVVDFLCLPNMVTTDLKDIFLTIGIAAIFVETLDNPDLSRSWQGGRQELVNVIKLVKDVVAFSWQGLRAGWPKLTRRRKNHEE